MVERVAQDALESLGLVSKTLKPDLPPRSTYQLTSSGRALQSVIDAIDSWASANLKS